jgi:Leucine-rich repeat (LRR) protein
MGELKNLRELFLWQNEIKKIPEEISGLQALKNLNLRGNTLSNDLEEKLKNWLPTTNIYFSSSCRCGF